MNRSVVFISSLIVGLVLAPFFCEGTSVTAEEPALVFSLLDEKALSVIHIQPAGLRQMPQETLAPIHLYLSTLPRTSQDILRTLIFDSEIADAYAIFRSGEPSRSSPGFSPLVAISNDMENAERVAQAAGDLTKLSRIDGLAILGNSAAIANVGAVHSPDIQQEFSDAFSKLHPGPLRCVVRIDDDRRRVIQEFGLADYENYLPFPTAMLAKTKWFAAAAIPTDEPNALSEVQLVFQPVASIDRDQFTREMRQGIEDKTGTQVSRTDGGEAVKFTLAFSATSKQLNNWVADTRLQIAKQRLQRIGLHIHNFHSAYGRLPGPTINDEEGKPLLSWRVELLPFLGGDEQRLWKRFHRDEPWDSPHNLALVNEMPSVYSVDASVLEENQSTVEIAMGDSLFFHDDESRFTDITDGLSNTIMAFEIQESKKKIWTKPSSLELAPGTLRENVGGRFGERVLVLNGDGSVRLINPQELGEAFWQRFTRNGGEILR